MATTGELQPAEVASQGEAALLQAAPASLIPPFSCANANADLDETGKDIIDISDPIFILSYLFLGASEEPPVFLSRVVKTGQGQAESQFPGDDGSYAAGLPRQFIEQDFTVVDAVTGLMWMKRPIDENLDELYNSEDNMTFPDAINHIEQINAGAGFDGFHDWRLPTIQELLTLCAFNNKIPASFPEFLFPFIPDYRYWTSTVKVNPDPTLPGDWSFMINFLPGHTGIDNQLTERWVRAVRNHHARPHEPGAPSPPAPFRYGNANGDDALDITDAVYILDYLFLGGPKPCVIDPLIIPIEQVPGTPERFHDNDDGTVTDRVSGLMWEKAPTTTTFPSQQAAVNRCNDLILAEHEDWRLPNNFELHSLIDFTVPGPFRVNPIFTLSNQDVFYTSSKDIITSVHWAISIMDVGSNHFTGVLHNNNWGNSAKFAWAVRGGL